MHMGMQLQSRAHAHAPGRLSAAQARVLTHLTFCHTRGSGARSTGSSTWKKRSVACSKRSDCGHEGFGLRKPSAARRQGAPRRRAGCDAIGCALPAALHGGREWVRPLLGGAGWPALFHPAERIGSRREPPGAAEAGVRLSGAPRTAVSNACAWPSKRRASSRILRTRVVPEARSGLRLRNMLPEVPARLGGGVGRPRSSRSLLARSGKRSFFEEETGDKQRNAEKERHRGRAGSEQSGADDISGAAARGDAPTPTAPNRRADKPRPCNALHCGRAIRCHTSMLHLGPQRMTGQVGCPTD